MLNSWNGSHGSVHAPSPRAPVHVATTNALRARDFLLRLYLGRVEAPRPHLPTRPAASR